MHIRSLRFILPLVLALTVLLVAPPFIARADSLTADPPSGTVGTVFQISGTGFAPGELVSLWISHPDGTIESQGFTTADGSGNISFSAIPTENWGYGFFVQVARGLRSKYETTVTFEFYSPEVGSSGSAATGCSAGVFYASGFQPNERVATWTGLPDGTYQPLPAVSADADGIVTFTWTPQFGWPGGVYSVAAQGYGSKVQAADDYYWDGALFTGEGDCTTPVVTDTGTSDTPAASSQGGTVLLKPNNVYNYQGAGVYLSSNPDELWYFDCNWKWVPFGSPMYMLVLGFQPNEQVKVSYEVFDVVSGVNYKTLNADENGNLSLEVDMTGLPAGHYHWWFQAKSVTYCGHFDRLEPSQ